MSIARLRQPKRGATGVKAPPKGVPYIRVVSFVRDDADGTWYAKICFDDLDGRRATLLKPRSALDRPGLLLNELSDQGYSKPLDEESRAALKHYFMAARPTQRQRLAGQMGWTPDGAYVFLDVVIGGPQGLWICDPKLERTTTAQTGGSLEEWQRLIAAPAVHSAYLMFAIAVAFASMLLGPVGVKSGIFHLHGTSGSRSRSSIGKTLCLRVANSVFGPANRLRHWDTTDTRLEELAAAFNDGLLNLDELAQTSFDEREIAQRVKRLAFMIEGESGKGRSLVYTGGKDAVTWRALVLSTGELGIAELAKQALAKRLKGEEVRAIDVPIEADPKLGIFHSLPEGYRHSGKLVDELEAHCRRYFGRPARAFAEGFAADREALIEQARHRMSWFKRKLRVPVEGWERRFAERFALAYAAARLAADLEILPWTQDQTFQAINTCYKAARGAIQDEGAMLREVLARVQASLAAERRLIDLRSDTAKSPSPKELRQARGFIKEGADGGVFYALKRKAFERLV